MDQYIILAVLATAGLVADWCLTLSDQHNGPDYEVNPVLKWLWKQFGSRGVTGYFAVWVAVFWGLRLVLLSKWPDTDADLWHVILCVCVMVASYIGVSSIRKNRGGVS